ncbi:hypothetical protein BEI_0500 [Halomonas beimenensis]|uniref:Uncharacterized protein n=1 Tax=Halomonas beimenensis TaxID=475662 RepID=A0A291P3M5_9GAMM|nr:hypothetical protein BEI_0500 [Halomonas beimenensis]
MTAGWRSDDKPAPRQDGGHPRRGRCRARRPAKRDRGGRAPRTFGVPAESGIMVVLTGTRRETRCR